MQGISPIMVWFRRFSSKHLSCCSAGQRVDGGEEEMNPPNLLFPCSTETVCFKRGALKMNASAQHRGDEEEEEVGVMMMMEGGDGGLVTANRCRSHL